jgi:AcrR family transcriptional regulator
MNDSKEHIIIISSKLFLQKNFKEVTMKEIVEKTGLSKGAFYHYFESKEKLFLEVLDYFFKQVSHNYENYSKESFYQYYNDYINDTINLTRKYLAQFNNELDEVSITMNYFSLMFDALKLFPDFREKVIDGFNKEIEYWTKAIELARSKGEIKSTMTDKEIGETFMYLSDGVGMHMIMRGMSVDNMVKPFKNLWDKLYDEIKA